MLRKFLIGAVTSVIVGWSGTASAGLITLNNTNQSATFLFEGTTASTTCAQCDASVTVTFSGSTLTFVLANTSQDGVAGQNVLTSIAFNTDPTNLGFSSPVQWVLGRQAVDVRPQRTGTVRHLFASSNQGITNGLDDNQVGTISVTTTATSIEFVTGEAHFQAIPPTGGSTKASACVQGTPGCGGDDLDGARAGVTLPDRRGVGPLGQSPSSSFVGEAFQRPSPDASFGRPVPSGPAARATYGVTRAQTRRVAGGPATDRFPSGCRNYTSVVGPPTTRPEVASAPQATWLCKFVVNVGFICLAPTDARRVSQLADMLLMSRAATPESPDAQSSCRPRRWTAPRRRAHVRGARRAPDREIARCCLSACREVGRLPLSRAVLQTNEHGDRLIVSKAHLLVHESLRGRSRKHSTSRWKAARSARSRWPSQTSRAYPLASGPSSVPRDARGRLVPHLRGQSILKLDAQDCVAGSTLSLAALRAEILAAR